MPDLMLRLDVNKLSRITSKRINIDNLTSKLGIEIEDKEGIQPNMGKEKICKKKIERTT